MPLVLDFFQLLYKKTICIVHGKKVPISMMQLKAP